MPTEPADGTDAYRFLERLRWPDGTPDRCPHCAATGGAWLLTPADGRSRATSTGARSVRRVWRCRACRRQFSVLTGTVLQGTRTNLRACLGMLRDGAAGQTSGAIAERYGVTPATVRHLLARVAAAEQAAGPASTDLRAVLALDADRAERIREATPARRRPRRQVGPSADYGD